MANTLNALACVPFAIFLRRGFNSNYCMQHAAIIVQFLQGAKIITQLFKMWFYVQFIACNYFIACRLSSAKKLHAIIVACGFMSNCCIQLLHAAIIAGIPICWTVCKYCTMLLTIVACNNCTWNHGISLVSCYYYSDGVTIETIRSFVDLTCNSAVN